MIFNTHTHLNDEQVEDVLQLIKNAEENDVLHMVVVGSDLKSSLKAIGIANEYKNVYAAVGIHPADCSNYQNYLMEFENIITKNNKIVAIGEIGLDYYYQPYDKEQQISCFETFIQIAIKHELPIIIHCRDAYLDTYNILEKYHKQLKGIIMHCYTGSYEMAKRFLSLGCYISIAGVVTFKNAKNIKEVAQNVPLDKLLVETDDPYLTPNPFRGKKNQPAYVRYVVEEIATLRNESVEYIKEQTTKNAIKVFNL